VPVLKGTVLQLKKQKKSGFSCSVIGSFHRICSATICIYYVREQRKYWAAISPTPLLNVVTRIVMCLEAFILWRSTSSSFLHPVISSLLHPFRHSADHYVNKYIVSLQRENRMCFRFWWPFMPTEPYANNFMFRTNVWRIAPLSRCQPAMLRSIQNT
jgi:hypothetical protein